MAMRRLLRWQKLLKKTTLKNLKISYSANT